MNIKKTFAIIGLLAVFTTTTAFATTGTYDQYLVSGDSSVAVDSQVKDDGEQTAYVTPDATSDWNPGLERYNVRVRDSSYNYAT